MAYGTTEQFDDYLHRHAVHIAYAGVLTAMMAVYTEDDPLPMEDVLACLSRLGLTLQLDPVAARKAYDRYIQLNPVD